MEIHIQGAHFGCSSPETVLRNVMFAGKEAYFWGDEISFAELAAEMPPPAPTNTGNDLSREERILKEVDWLIKEFPWFSDPFKEYEKKRRMMASAKGNGLGGEDTGATGSNGTGGEGGGHDREGTALSVDEIDTLFEELDAHKGTARFDFNLHVSPLELVFRTILIAKFNSD